MFDLFFHRPEPEPILRSVFNGWETGDGIFRTMHSVSDELPWLSDPNIDPLVLDVEYFGNTSGSKFCSPIVKHLLDDNDQLPQSARATLANILITKYLPRWKALWRTATVEYNPIHNYDMTENRTLHGAESEAEVGASTETNTGTDTLTHGRTETIAHGRTSDSMSYRYGINTNTEDPKPSDKDTYEEGGTTETEITGDDVQTKNLSTGINSTKNTVGANEEVEELHRAGNIGVTTTQQMLESERRLWEWNFFDQVFRDLDKELALQFYDPCQV